MRLKLQLPFLPYWAKYPGLVLLLLGAIGLYWFGYQNQRPDWLQLDVFTAYSYFLSTKTFAIIKNNQGDEISTLLFFLGAFVIMVSAEKNEQPVHQTFRIKAMALTAILTMVVFVIVYLLLHGLAITYFSLILPYLIPLLYLFVFFILNKRGK